MSITVSSTAKMKTRAPRAFLVAAKNAVLGASYELSLAFVTSAEIRKLNQKFRGKNTATDILSFSLSPDSGEIILCMDEVERQAPLFKRTAPNFLKFLFIHGLLHLKGYAHGGTMEKQEKKFRQRFNV